MVVALIAVLAAIAIPQFHEMQLKSKRAELQPLSDAISISVVGYVINNDPPGPGASTWNPRDPSTTKVAVDWNGGDADWVKIAWTPDGQIRGTYRYAFTTLAARSYGRIDVDDDDAHSAWTSCVPSKTVEHPASPRAAMSARRPVIDPISPTSSRPWRSR